MYKKYIKRDGKIFGPYYYESYRDGDGQVRTRYIEKTEKNSYRIWIIFLIIGLFLGLILAGFIFRQAFVIYSPDESFFIGDVSDFESTFDEDSDSFALTEDGAIIYFNYSFGEVLNLKMSPEIGRYSVDCFNGENFEEFILIDEETDRNFSIPDNCQKNLQIKIIYSLYEENETEIPENETEIPENETEIPENETEIPENETEIPENETEIPENITIEREVNASEEIPEEPEEEIPEEPEEEIPEEPEEEIPEEPEEAPITGESILEDEGRFYEIIVYRMGVENKTTNFSIKQYKAVIGRAVKWVKKIKAGSEKNISLEIPKQAQEIVVKTGGEAGTAFQEADNYENVVKNADRSDIVSGVLTGAVVEKSSLIGIITGLFITGEVIQEEELTEEIIETDDEKIINISKIVDETGDDEIAVEYYTPAPEAFEENIPDGKRVNVTGPEDVHYEDILAYSELDNRIKIENIDKIKLYWHNGSEKREVNFDAYDLDDDGKIDYIEWIVPHLSSQVYEIIYITRAVHLDSDRNFISDITDETRMPDGIWSEEIEDGEYARVNFERNLTSGKDITILARGSGNIEVYMENRSEIIAIFENISDEGYYKVFLDNLEGSNDVFDLKVLGNVEFDWIVDPTYNIPTEEVYTCGEITGSGTYGLNQSIYNFDDIAKEAQGCIEISVNNVVLDCHGYAIYNISSEDTSTGIFTANSNVTIKNCNISTAGTGINLNGQNSNDSFSINNTISNANKGIEIDWYDASIINNTFIKNNYALYTPGVALSSSGYANITGNNFNYNNYSIHVRGHYMLIGNNNFLNCSINCIELFESSNSLFENMTMNMTGYGIYVDGVECASQNNIFRNISIYNSINDSIYVISYTENFNYTFENITIYSPESNNAGIYLHAGDVIIRDSSITTSSEAGYGIKIEYNSNYPLVNKNISIINNTLINQYSGLQINSSINGSFLNNTISGNTNDGIYINNAINNTFSGNRIQNNGGQGIHLISGSNNTFSGNTVSGNFKDFSISPDVVDKISFTNQNLEIAKPSFGGIAWTNPVTFSTNNLGNDIQILSNSIFVNSSIAGLNTSARLTFYGISGYSDRWILRNGAVCPETICTEIQDSVTYIVDVTGFTTYSVGGVLGEGEDGGGAGQADCGVFNNWCNGADVNQDGRINILDLILIRNQLGQKCSAPDWCNGADVNQDGVVDINDLIFTRNNFWGSGGGTTLPSLPAPAPPEEIKIPVVETESGSSSYECSEWGECLFNYKFENLVEGVEKISGEQKRVCSDKSGIGDNLIQTRKCFLGINISVEEREFCNENYLWIYNKDTGKLLGRILDKKNETNPRFDIEFLDAVPEYCGYCYNRVMDEDETGVDCGGSCKECISYSPNLNWFDMAMEWLGF